MSNSGDIALILSFCSALAATGAYYIQYRRLKLERAMVVVAAVVLDETEELFDITLLNVGSRPAFDINATTSSLQPGVFLEGLKAGGTHRIKIQGVGKRMELTLAYRDAQTGVAAEKRSISATSGEVVVGRRECVETSRLPDRNVLPETFES